MLFGPDVSYAPTTTDMSPEEIEKNPCGSAVDIWSIGVISYILVAGEAPFKGAILCHSELFLVTYLANGLNNRTEQVAMMLYLIMLVTIHGIPTHNTLLS